MKRKMHLALLVTSLIAILTTLLFSMLAFYGQFREQVVGDLRTDALVLKNLGFFENPDEVRAEHLRGAGPGTDNLRITVIQSDGEVLFDTDKSASQMENHLNRPEVQSAFSDGEGSGSRRSETLEENLFYYAVRLDNGTVLRVSKEAKSFLAVLANLFPMVLGGGLVLFALSTVLAHYFTAWLVAPIERMAEHISEPGARAVYPELQPFAEKIRQQHADILKSAKVRQEFTANVSHELKTPLTAISGYSELIEHGMAGADDTVRFAGEIHKNAARLLTLINDIIQLSQLDDENRQLEYSQVDLHALAAECISQLRLNAKKQNVTMQLCGTACEIRADKQLMEELVYNLCDNAIRYNNRGGYVYVTTDRENGHAVLKVKDTGIGISREHQDRVFERFYRVDKSRSKATGGTGLGLAIVKHIVSQHGARLSLESEPGKGTEIRVDFAAD